jgi:hypothetical protein
MQVLRSFHLVMHFSISDIFQQHKRKLITFESERRQMSVGQRRSSLKCTRSTFQTNIPIIIHLFNQLTLFTVILKYRTKGFSFDTFNFDLEILALKLVDNDHLWNLPRTGTFLCFINTSCFAFQFKLHVSTVICHNTGLSFERDSISLSRDY